jgi:quercetin dioxygenase-like cupin family protein
LAKIYKYHRRIKMNFQKTLVIGGAAACCLIAGLTMATPTVGAFYNNILSAGLADNDIHGHGFVQLGDEDFTAEVHAYGASNVIVQDVKFSPGGTTGWHTHPGVLLLTLAADSGPVDWYDAHCGKITYKAGDTWTEGTKLHDVVNNSSMDAHFVVTYLVPATVPAGANKRTDEPAPRCAAALGLK